MGYLNGVKQLHKESVTPEGPAVSLYLITDSYDLLDIPEEERDSELFIRLDFYSNHSKYIPVEDVQEELINNIHKTQIDKNTVCDWCNNNISAGTEHIVYNFSGSFAFRIEKHCFHSIQSDICRIARNKEKYIVSSMI